MYTDQSSFDIRFEWGLNGLAAVDTFVVIIVDILSFSTCVDIVVGNSAVVYPALYGADPDIASIPDAVVASRRRSGAGFSLSPSSLTGIPAGTNLVLPSPNGATLSVAAAARRCVPAGCLRNRRAVASFAAAQGAPVTVVAAGERWSDGSIRFALEDMLGAGAIVNAPPGTRSSEALAAEQVFISQQVHAGAVVRNCSSSRELIERGFSDDIDLAVCIDCSTAVPLLRNSAYGNAVS